MKAHILILADGRSPTAQSWIKNLQALDYDLSLISTYPCERLDDLANFEILPVAFSRFRVKSGSGETNSQTKPVKKLVRRFTPALQSLRYILGPLSLLPYANTYRELVRQIMPDVVHALRIPFEGMLGSYTPEQIPFLVATWGNDLTLHASSTALMRHFTQRCLARADGLTSDTQRDVRLAREWGLDPDASALVVPGSGGLDIDAIDLAGPFDASLFEIPENRPWVINPRSIRPGSIHQEVFFESIPIILAKRPDAIFICPSMAGVPQADQWLQQFGVAEQTYLLPKLSQPHLWSLFKKSAVFVSPSSHDGTPNTLLEAMTCGCFPVVGDIESLREWINPGINGLLTDPTDPEELAAGILQALNHPNLRQQAADLNRKIIKNRAAQSATRPKIKQFYEQFIS